MHTVDREKIARKLDQAVSDAGRSPLDVLIQVNTSDEDQKSGCSVLDAPGLAQAIVDSCPHLRLAGLMTIGAAGVDPAPFFAALARARDEVASALGLSPEQLALSMGMSADFEQAIAAGATHVRVGSSIFGAREGVTPAASTLSEASTARKGTPDAAETT